jgi:hypothetical protein
MRQKKESLLCFASNDDGLPKVVRDYRARYRTISQVLDKNLEILNAVHQDIKHLSQGGRKGRKGDFTSENILRALIVQHLEGLPFRETVIRIGGGRSRWSSATRCCCAKRRRSSSPTTRSMRSNSRIPT